MPIRELGLPRLHMPFDWQHGFAWQYHQLDHYVMGSIWKLLTFWHRRQAMKLP
jgi:hypothetical protein